MMSCKFSMRQLSGAIAVPLVGTVLVLMTACGGSHGTPTATPNSHSTSQSQTAKPVPSMSSSSSSSNVPSSQQSSQGQGGDIPTSVPGTPNTPSGVASGADSGHWTGYCALVISGGSKGNIVPANTSVTFVQSVMKQTAHQSAICKQMADRLSKAFALGGSGSATALEPSATAQKPATSDEACSGMGKYVGSPGSTQTAFYAILKGTGSAATSFCNTLNASGA